MMKRTLSWLGMGALIWLAGCSNGGTPADATWFNDGFRGITYTSPDGPAPVGPVDGTDWKSDGRWDSRHPIVPCGGVAPLSRQTKADTSVHSDLPETFAAFPAYPNPFNPTTAIGFALPVSCHVYAAIINDRYETVQVLICEELNEGVHVVVWSAIGSDDRALPSDVYRFIIRCTDDSGNFLFASHGDLWLAY